MLPDNPTKPIDKPVMSLSAFSIQGKRNHMEDFFDIGYQMKPCDQLRPNEWPYEYFYFGIFDGHGGSEAASFAKENLLGFIVSEKDFWSNDDEDVKRAIRNGFAATHAAMKREMHMWCRTSRVLPSTAGTTASVLFIRNGKFYSGHVGDSRIIICNENPRTKAWITDQLTEDHKPESRTETERIERAGGEVKSKIGVHRVVWRRPVLNNDFGLKLMFGQDETEYNKCMDKLTTYPVEESLVESYQTIPFLAIARSLGDFWSLNPHSGQYIVSPEPDVSCRPITSQDKCILLATDGLWNVIHSTMAVRILQELDLVKGSNKKQQYVDNEYLVTDNFYDVAGNDEDNPALSLVYYAYQLWERRRLRSDNITVVVAMLHDILSQFHKSTNNPYSTRANPWYHNVEEDEVLEHKFARSRLVQIRQTHAFRSEIRTNTEPDFTYDLPYVNGDDWQRLEKRLVLPPTLMVFEKKYYKWPKVVEPKNFERLTEAPCRSISVQTDDGEIFIQIKNVSDDPADEKDLPKRINKSGKEVKDCSAQATQSMHDFGIPWSQLCYDSMSDYGLDEEGLVDEDGAPFIPRLPNESIEIELEAEEVEEEDEEAAVASKSKVHEKPKKEEKSIPQLRCLLNRTPPLRRSSRHTYLSVSDNAKRKVPIPASAPASKSKRRKSQPVRCNLARV